MANDETGRGSSVVLAAWGALLAVEAIGLSFRFDFGVLWEGLADAPWWRPLLLNAGQVPRIAIVAAFPLRSSG